ncbi:hypothetical protein NG774_04125 [Aliarcobacter cryaerophilus]|uniref:hypothetical protein n=1 Tax=Aliarcobacter cryaerophilus TaxID=28198 RepID=UPI003DA23FE4
MFKILDEVCTPKRGTKYSAYVDLFAREDVTIAAGETKIVKLGVKIDIEKLKYAFFDWYSITESFEKFWGDLGDEYLKSHYLEVALRSSLGAKGLIIANGIGIIDLDYLDEIGLIVHNPIISIEKEVQFDKDDDYIEIDYWGVPNKKEHSGAKRFKISKGDKVAQCTLKEHKGYLMGYESDTIREGGFGSTGK